MSKQYVPKTFQDVYNLHIAPKLKELDIFLKEREFPVTMWQVSQLLDMPYDEVEDILHILQIETITHKNIYSIIMSGTSRLCGLIQREAQRGFPVYYTPRDISYIYEIDQKDIEEIFEALDISKIEGRHMHRIFENLPACT